MFAVEEKTDNCCTFATTRSETSVHVHVYLHVHTPDPGDAHKNLYVFCENNPVNFVDPMGLCTDGFWGSLGDNLSRQGLSIAAFWASVGANIGGNGDLASTYMQMAVDNSGHQMLVEANASDAAFAAYYGSLGVSGAAAGGAAALTGTGGAVVDIAITLITGEVGPGGPDHNPSPPPPIESPF